MTNAYLVLVEIERKGFLIKILRSEAKAKQLLDELVELSVGYPFREMYKVEKDLSYFASYKIYGTEVYCRKSSHSCSNGSYTVSIVEIDLDTFSVKIFMRERENHSCTLHHYSDSGHPYPNRYDKLLELFPRLSAIAN